MSTLSKTWKGVFGFPVTPFREDLSLDLDGLARHVDWMSSYPFCALVAVGGLGEMYSLTPDEIEQVVSVTVDAARGRLPVIASTGFNAAIGSHIARRAERAGAVGLLVLPPYYTNAPEAGLFDYYAAIGKASGLELMVYSRDWAAFTPSQVARLAERVPTLAGWKDGQGDARKYQRIMQHVGDRIAWFGGIGDDAAQMYFAIGVQAYTSSVSVLCPELSIAIASAGMARDFVRLEELLRKYVHPLFAIRERMRGYEVSAMKAAMEMLGRPAGPVRPPLPRVRDEDLADLREYVAQRLMAAAPAVVPAQDGTSGPPR